MVEKNMQKSKIKVVDNFLPDDQFKDISEGMLGNFFPWFWQKHSHGYKLEDGTFIEDNIPQLTHCFSDNGNIFSEYFKYFENSSLFNKLNTTSISRFKANCNYRTSEQTVGWYHTDYTDERKDKLTTSIFYINTNNGGTKFEDDTFVNSVSNRMVTFDCSLKHAPVSCTDSNRRIVININYTKLKNE